MAYQDKQELAPVLFLPHGGGPLPLLGDPGHKNLIEFLSTIAKQFEQPKALVVVSAHWEEETLSVTGKSDPGLYYDYYNFPEESYHIKYPLKTNVALTQRVCDLFEVSGIPCRRDEQRDFDHGVFVPLKLVFPQADIPCVQVSLSSSLNPALHVEIGKALAPLRTENVMIVGSGLSFHNMGAIKGSLSGGFDEEANNRFEGWLIEACTSNMLDEKEREQRLVNWESAPFARYCHPREEHLLPLHVCYGAASSPATLVFNDKVLGVNTSGFLW